MTAGACGCRFSKPMPALIASKSGLGAGNLVDPPAALGGWLRWSWFSTTRSSLGEMAPFVNMTTQPCSEGGRWTDSVSPPSAVQDVRLLTVR